ncbi:hypothetical protein HDU76_005170 [Blyttiomyces sp. JEL0837]|nr:hypothetical protein HDU76_005170 [Blyttiomyces sp. JEL0837]
MVKKDNEAKKVDIEEHLLTFEQLKALHKTDFNEKKPTESKGLSAAEAAQRLQTNGPNILSPPKKKSMLLLYFECLFTLFNLLLLISGVLTYVLYGIDPKDNPTNTYVGAILIVVACLNAFIEFYQLMQSEKILSGFLNLIPSKCQVIRDGGLIQTEAANLVTGDVVFVRLGDKCPADIYIFYGADMKVDNSSLTGEAEPQERIAQNTNTNPLEATNLAFNGTLVVAGEAYGVVIRCGDSTVLGQIAGLTQNEKKSMSPLNREINNFVMTIGAVAITSAIVFFIIALVDTKNISFALNFAVGVLVAWVPQGLPATVTMLLTIAAKRMATQQVLVKDLTGVETLGAITLLATDKTGTLTRNQMTVTNFWTGLKLYSAASEGIISDEENAFDFNVKGISEIVHIAAMCTRARFDKTDVPVAERTVTGDATESGLFRFAGQKLKDIDQLGNKYEKVFEIPFNSETKWHMAIHKRSHANGSFTLSMKGAPERILKVCSTILDSQGNAIPMTDGHKMQFNESYEWMAGKGHRVLAFAQLLLPGSEYPDSTQFSKEAKNYPTTELTFVGLASLEDPPKHGVREAIGRCREAGIKIMMVTGDHPLTAEAIGRKINLMLSDTKEKVAKRTNRQVEDIDESEYHAIVIHAAAMILLDDNFASVVSGIKEGRLIFVNLKKSISYVVSHIIPEVIPFLLWVVVPVPVMLAPLQILVVDLGFELLAALSYAWELPETKKGLMKVPPRCPVNRDTIARLKQRKAEDIEDGMGEADEEAGGEHHGPGLAARIARFFSARHWKRMLEKPDGEVLVDTEVLSWAYVEAGGIETIGCMAAFFCVLWAGTSPTTGQRFSISPYESQQMQMNGTFFLSGAPTYTTLTGNVLNDTDQVDALAQAQSAFYFCLMIQQMFNLFACKCRSRLPFGAYVFKNRFTWISIIAGAGFAAVIVYGGTPFNTGFSTSYHLNPLFWLIGMAGGLILIAYSTLRRIIRRLFKPTIFNPDIPGLRMEPTRWSTGK